MPAYVPDAGHIIKVDLGSGIGHEQGGWRPALVLSPKSYNSKTGLMVVVPITNQAKGYTFEVPLPESIETGGVVLSDAIKNVDWRARKTRFVEPAPSYTVDAVLERLALLLGLPAD